MSEPRCRYGACNHALAVGHNCVTDELLCDYHADGQEVIEGLLHALIICLEARHHGLSGTLDSLDVEIAGIRELYGIEDDDE